MDDVNGQNEAAAGGPGSIELAGRTYLVGQPNDQDFAAIRNRLRANLQNPIQAIAEDLKYLPRQYHDAAIKAAVALKAGGGAELTESYIRERLIEPDGASFLGWLMIRKHHPEVTLEDIRPHFTAETTSQILAKLYEASGLEAVQGGKGIGRTG
jgi:hypothetical protein